MSDSKRPDDEFSLPHRLEVTDLEGKPALPPIPRAASSTIGELGSIALEESPLELEPRLLDLPLEEIPPRRVPWRAIGFGVLICVVLAGLLVGVLVSMRQTRTNAILDLVHVPPGAQLVLDGEPIVGHRLVLPVSGRKHRLTVNVPGQPPKTIALSSLQDATIDLEAR